MWKRTKNTKYTCGDELELPNIWETYWETNQNHHQHTEQYIYKPQPKQYGIFTKICY